MKQALEALDCIKSPLHVREMRKLGEAMGALRQAIAEAETAPVHAIDMTQERVDETAKREHEPVAWHEPGAYGNVTTHKDWALANGWEPLYKEKT